MKKTGILVAGRRTLNIGTKIQRLMPRKKSTRQTIKYKNKNRTIAAEIPRRVKDFEITFLGSSLTLENLGAANKMVKSPEMATTRSHQAIDEPKSTGGNCTMKPTKNKGRKSIMLNAPQMNVIFQSARKPYLA